MPIVIIPNYISDAIDAKLDAEIAKHPDAARDRAAFRSYLIGFLDEHGFLPDFTLEKKP